MSDMLAHLKKQKRPVVKEVIVTKREIQIKFPKILPRDYDGGIKWGRLQEIAWATLAVLVATAGAVMIMGYFGSRLYIKATQKATPLTFDQQQAKQEADEAVRTRRDFVNSCTDNNSNENVADTSKQPWTCKKR